MPGGRSCLGTPASHAARSRAYNPKFTPSFQVAHLPCWVVCVSASTAQFIGNLNLLHRAKVPQEHICFGVPHRVWKLRQITTNRFFSPKSGCAVLAQSSNRMFDGAAIAVTQPIAPALLKGLLRSHSLPRNMGWLTVCFLGFAFQFAFPRLLSSSALKTPAASTRYSSQSPSVAAFALQMSPSPPGPCSALAAQARHALPSLCCLLALLLLAHSVARAPHEGHLHPP